MAWKTLDVPIYGVHIEAHRNRRSLAASIGEEVEIGDNVNGCCVLFDEADGASIIMGWFDDRRSTLVHECCHAALFILNRAGIDPRDSDGETMSYLLGYLVTQLGIDR